MIKSNNLKDFVLEEFPTLLFENFKKHIEKVQKRKPCPKNVVQRKIKKYEKEREILTKISKVLNILLKYKVTNFQDLNNLEQTENEILLNNYQYLVNWLLFFNFKKHGDKSEKYNEITNTVFEQINEDVKSRESEFFRDIALDKKLRNKLREQIDIVNNNLVQVITNEKDTKNHEQFYRECLQEIFAEANLYFKVKKNRECFTDILYYSSELKRKRLDKYFIELNDDVYIAEVTKEYQNIINNIDDKISEISELIKALTPDSKSILLKSPNHLYDGTQNVKQSRELVKNLSKLFGSDIDIISKVISISELEQTTNVKEKRTLLSSFIERNLEKAIEYKTGIKLNKTEDMIFSAFRFLAIKSYRSGLIDSPSRKVTVKTSDFFKLCNLKKRNDGGYDTNQKAKIKETLQSGQLTKSIFYENNKSFFFINFVKFLHWNNDNTITYEIDEMFFVNDKTKKDGYYCEDLEGRNKLISEMPNSSAVYNLHKYLSYALRSDKQSFNVTLLLESSELITSYKKGQRKRALETLQEILDKMYEVKTIIGNKPVKIPSASDDLGKYELKKAQEYKKVN